MMCKAFSFLLVCVCITFVSTEMIPYYIGDTMIMVDPENLGLSQPVMDLLKKGLPNRIPSARSAQSKVTVDNISPRKVMENNSIPPKNREDSIEERGFPENPKLAASSDTVIKRIIQFIENEIGAQMKYENTNGDFSQRKLHMNHRQKFHRNKNYRSYESIIDKLRIEFDDAENEEIDSKFRNDLSNLNLENKPIEEEIEIMDEQHEIKVKDRVQNGKNKFREVVDNIWDIITDYKKETSNVHSIEPQQSTHETDDLEKYLQELLQIKEALEKSETKYESPTKPKKSVSESKLESFDSFRFNRGSDSLETKDSNVADGKTMLVYYNRPQTQLETKSSVDTGLRSRNSHPTDFKIFINGQLQENPNEKTELFPSKRYRHGSEVLEEKKLNSDTHWTSEFLKRSNQHFPEISAITDEIPSIEKDSESSNSNKFIDILNNWNFDLLEEKTERKNNNQKHQSLSIIESDVDYPISSYSMEDKIPNENEKLETNKYITKKIGENNNDSKHNLKKEVVDQTEKEQDILEEEDENLSMKDLLKEFLQNTQTNSNSPETPLKDENKIETDKILRNEPLQDDIEADETDSNGEAIENEEPIMNTTPITLQEEDFDDERNNESDHEISKDSRMKMKEIGTKKVVIPKNSCQCGLPLSKRIIGGGNADIENHPWMVRLIRRETKKLFCGGTLINDRFVLTAAHCVFGIPPRSIFARFGSANVSRGHRRQVKKVIPHPDYIDGSFQGDLALVQLKHIFRRYQSNILPICLPTLDMDFNLKTGVISGWGSTDALFGTKATTLQEAEVTIWNSETCLSMSDFKDDQLKENQLCARKDNTDSCDGDSGGPLAYSISDRYFQAGITSFGIKCALPNYPGVYTKTQAYLDWISEQTSRAEYCKVSGNQITNITEPSAVSVQELTDDKTITDFLQNIVSVLKNKAVTTFNSTIIILDNTTISHTSNSSHDASKEESNPDPNLGQPQQMISNMDSFSNLNEQDVPLTDNDSSLSTSLTNTTHDSNNSTSSNTNFNTNGNSNNSSLSREVSSTSNSFTNVNSNPNEQSYINVNLNNNVNKNSKYEEIKTFKGFSNLAQQLKNSQNRPDQNDDFTTIVSVISEANPGSITTESDLNISSDQTFFEEISTTEDVLPIEEYTNSNIVMQQEITENPDEVGLLNES